MVVFLLNQTFDEGAFWTKSNFFILLHAEQKIIKTDRIFHIGWKYIKFNWKLLDGEEYLSDFWFNKQDMIYLCQVFGLPDTTKT